MSHLQHCQTHRIRLLSSHDIHLAAAPRVESKTVSIRFLPDDFVVNAQCGKKLLDVAIEAGQLKESPQEPFCRDGGCYKCEMEVAGFSFPESPLIRTCKYVVPETNSEICLTRVDEVWAENLL
eukprot:jgi/Galph1/5855/GphlegSOOS_G4512.1